MRKPNAIEYWYGDESSFDVLAQAQKSVQIWAKANQDRANKEFELPPLYTRHGDVGVIDIKGTLYTGRTGIFRLFGVLGYEDIEEAMYMGLKDTKAKRLMLNVESPGGAVVGLKPLVEVIRALSEVKSVGAYATTANSAAYWLASTADHITLDEMGEAGSIGCISVHTEYSKAYEKEGVTKTVIRAGENKALANTFEPLSDKAKEQIQYAVNKARDMFVQGVAQNRGVTVATVESQFGQGKVFIGTDAVNAGLVDSVGTFQDALAHRA